MSTSTQTQSSVESVVATISPEDVFDDVVWENREICNGCFAQIRRVVRNDTELWGRANVPEIDSRRALGGLHGHAVEEHDDYGELCTFPGRTFCRECGSQSGAAADDPLPRRRALEAARSLAARLQDAGVDVDDRALLELVRECKSRSELQAQDTEIFRRATRLGVRRGRRRRRE